MGGNTFETGAKGKSANEAFRAAVKQAQYDYGHAGYTGTIAEKQGFVEIPIPVTDPPTDPLAYARTLIDNGDPRIDDKWGPAGCITIGPGEYLFFGWASS